MNSQPTVSVVITTKNRHELLPRAIDSVLAQTWKGLEVIVVDDGSDEPAQYHGTDSRVRVIRNEQSKGLSGARNVGFRAARGQFFAMLDDDDWYLPDKLETQLRYLREHPEVDLVFSRVVVQDATGTRRHYLTLNHVHDPDINLRAFNVIHPASCLYRRHIFDAVPFEERVRKYEDTLFFNLVCVRFRTAYLPGDVAIWMQDGRPDQLTKVHFRKNYDSFRVVCEKLSETIGRNRELARLYYGRLGYQALRCMEFGEAARCAWRIVTAG